MRLPHRRRAPQPTRPEQPERSRWGFLKFVAGVLLLAWAFRSFVFAPFSISSGSMLPALYIGDYVLVAKWPYGYSRYSFPFGIPSFDGRVVADLPERGDIVIFRPPGAEIDFVKRVIGLPGDTVEVRGGMLLLNGRPIVREAEGMAEVPISRNSPCRVVAGASPQVARGSCLYPAYRETLAGGRSWLVLDQVETPRADDVPPTRVPQGHLYLMGDNRDDSLDSRFVRAEGGIGFVPLENVIGRATMVFWSTDGTAHYLLPWTWFGALRVDRLGSGFSGERR
jgi:signal peptidase I